MKNLFNSSQLSFQALRLLSEVTSGQADVNEVLDTCEKINEDSYESWYEEWARTADRVKNYAEDFLKQGHAISAADTFLRASNYYRAAGFYRGVLLSDGCDKETQHKLEKLDYDALKCFEKFIQYGETAIQPVEIPYEQTTLPGHFYKVQSGYEKAPTLIMLNGYDGTKEEMYGNALEALKRGMNCLAFEGPGQGEMIRTRNIPFRPDWENVITPVVDYLIDKLHVEPHKIVLWGESMGGYLAPRAVAFEHRLAACIANSGVLDFMGCHAPQGMDREDFKKIIVTAPEDKLEEVFQQQMASNVQINWAFKHGMYVFQAKNLKDYMVKAMDYYIGDAVKQIRCPMLVIDTENESNFPGQAKKLYDELDSPKDYLLFTKEQGTAEHCEEGAKLFANACIFNWIEKHISRNINKNKHREIRE